MAVYAEWHSIDLGASITITARNLRKAALSLSSLPRTGRARACLCVQGRYDMAAFAVIFGVKYLDDRRNYMH